MSADTGTYRLITRPDFDGVVCGALFMEQDMIDTVMFAHPRDMQHGKIAVSSEDITTNLPYVPGVGEVCVICGAIVGSGLGFLWFNTYPAMVFMGDVGALALGAALGIVAVIIRQELVLLIMGGVFVIETLSVIIQVASFKLRGKRVFKMAPIHHHFELSGWPEPRVIVRFWIITAMLVLFGLATLKLR